MHVLDEVHHVEGVLQLEEGQAPHCKAAVVAAGHQLVRVEGTDAQAVDALHVVRQRAQDQPEDFGLHEVPHADHSVLATADSPELVWEYIMESSSLVISHTLPRLHYVIRWTSFPFLGEKTRTESSLHPETMYLPFLGKCRERHCSLGKAMRSAGASVFVFHTMISPPEQVPNISEYPLRKATELILVEQQV